MAAMLPEQNPRAPQLRRRVVRLHVDGARDVSTCLERSGSQLAVRVTRLEAGGSAKSNIVAAAPARRSHSQQPYLYEIRTKRYTDYNNVVGCALSLRLALPHPPSHPLLQHWPHGPGAPQRAPSRGWESGARFRAASR